MELLSAAAVFITDAVVAFLIWRARGKPLPSRLEWMRVHPMTAWLCHLLEKPVYAGL